MDEFINPYVMILHPRRKAVVYLRRLGRESPAAFVLFLSLVTTDRGELRERTKRRVHLGFLVLAARN
jgi:hypothetical protein